MTDLVISQHAKSEIADYQPWPHHWSMGHAVKTPDAMDPEMIGDRLRMLRESHGLRPSEIADMLDIERTYWSRFEKGRRTIPLDKAYLLVDRFGVTLDWIILGRWETLSFEMRERLRSNSAR